MSKVTVRIVGHIGHRTSDGVLHTPGTTFEATATYAEKLLKRFPGMYEVVKDKSYIPKKEVANE